MLGSLTLSGCAFLDFFKSKKNDTPADTGGGGEEGGGEHKEDKYTVSFDANGGTGSMSAASEVSGEYTLPECGFTAPEGKEFNGWKIGAEGEVKQPGEKITVEADITLIAQWKDGTGPVVAKYTVTFNVQGHGQAPQSVEVNEGGKVTKPTDPSAEGWTFGGWYKEADCENAWDFDTDTVSAATTLYAKWTEKTPEPPAHEPPFIQLKSGESDWVYTTLETDPEEGKDYQYKVAELEVKAGDEFVFCVAAEDWRNFDKMDADNSSASDILEDSGDDHNFKVTADATLDIYIIKEAGGSVYINLHSVTPEPPVHEPPFIQHKSAEGDWVYTTLETDPEEGKDYQYKVAELEVKAGDEFVFCVAAEDWRNFDKMDADNSSASDILEDSGDDHNFKVTADATLDIYIIKEAGGSVYINLHSVTPEPPVVDVHKLVINRVGEDEPIEVNLTLQSESTTEYKVEGQQLEVGDEFTMVVGTTEYKYADLKLGEGEEHAGGGVQDLFEEATDGSIKVKAAHKYNLFVETAESGKGIYTFASYFQYQEPEGEWLTPDVSLKVDAEHEGPITEYVIGQDEPIHLKAGTKFLFRIGEKWYKYADLKEGVTGISGDEDGNLVTSVAGNYTIYCETVADDHGDFIWVVCEPDVVPPEETDVSLTVTHGEVKTKHNLTQIDDTTLFSVDGLVLEAGDTIVVEVNGTEYGFDKLGAYGVPELFELKDEKFTCIEQHTYEFTVESDPSEEIDGKAVYADCEDYFKYSNADGTVWTTIPVSLKEDSEHEYELPEVELVKGSKFMFNVHDRVADDNPVRSYYKELKQSPIHNDEFNWFDTEGSDPEVLVGGTYHIYCQTPETDKETGLYITGVVDASRNYVEIIRHDAEPTDPAEHFPLQFKDEGKIFYDEFMRRETLEAGDKIRFMVNGAWAELFKDDDPAAANFKAPDEEHYLEVKAECGATFAFYIALLGTGKVIWVQTYTAPVQVAHNIIFDQDWVASDDAEIYVWVWGSGIAGHWEKLEIQEALGQKYAEVTWLSTVSGFKVYRFNKNATHKPVVNDPEAEGPGDFTRDVEYWNCSTDDILVNAETENLHVNNVA